MEILDGVEDRAAPHELGEPGKQQVRFVAHIALDRPARPHLERVGSGHSPASAPVAHVRQ
jgi:hypothetical protein